MARSDRPRGGGSASLALVHPGLPGLLPAAALVVVTLGGIALAGIGVRDPFAAFDRAAVFAGLSGLAGVAVLAMGRSRLIRADRLTVSWGAVLGWALLSTVLSGRFWAALVGERTSMVGWSALAALTLVALAAAALAPQIRRVLAVISPWLLLAESGLVAYQLSRGFEPGGSLPNSTYLGAALLLLLPWAFVAEDAPALNRVIRYAAIVATLAVLAASGSRIALVLALVWFGWNLLTGSKLSRRTRIAVAVIALLAVVVSAVAFSRSEIASTVSRTTLGERPQMYALAAKAAIAKPLTGWGPDGFYAGGTAVSTIGAANAGTLYVPTPGGFDPHNLALFTAVSIGWAGLGLVAWFVWEVARRWRAHVRVSAGIAPAMWATVLSAALFMTAPAVVHILPLFALMLGVSLGSSRERSAETVPVAVSMPIVVVLTIASIVLAANAATRAAYEGPSEQRSPALAAKATSAARAWGSDPYLAYLAALHNGYAAASDPAVMQARTDLALIERAVTLDERDALYPLELARTLRFYYAPEAEIEAAFLESLRRYPAYPTANAEYGLYLAQRGRLEEAKPRIDLATKLTDFTPERIAAVQAAQEILSGGSGQ